MSTHIRSKKQPRHFLAASLSCAVLGGALYSLYLLVGHQFIAAFYSDDPNSLLTHLLQRRTVVPLSFYTDLLDKNAPKLLFLPLATFLFYFTAYRMCFYLWNQSADIPLVPAIESSSSMKHDLLIALSAYSLILCAYFAPLLGSIGESLIGPPEDNMKYLWNMWWGYRSIIEKGGTLSYSNFIFYPEGSSLLYNDYSWYNLVVSLGLSPFLNPVGAYNVIIFHSFILSGLGAFLLTRYLTQHSLAAFVAGFLYAFNPSHFAHSLHHINTASIQFIPFFVLFFLRSIGEGGKKNVILASAFFFLNALCDWNYLIFSGYFIGSTYIYLALKRKAIINTDILLKVAAIVVVPLIVLSPWLSKMARLGLTGADLNAFHVGHNMYVADLVGLVVPHSYHFLGGMFDAINRTFTGNRWESAVYLGVVNIVTLMIVFRKIVREAAVYLTGLVIFIILSMGSFIHVLGQTMPVILPYSLLANIPLLSQARAPARMIVFVYLFLAIVMGFAVKHLSEKYKAHSRMKYVVALIIGLLMADYYSLGSDATQVRLPRCYSVIASREKVGAILDLPGGWEESARYMMYQTYHGIPIVQGALPRKVGKSLIDNLHLADWYTQRNQLVENGIQYIVVHKSPIIEGRWIDSERYRSFYNAACEDDKISVFEVY
jgi:hypothetical protein